MVVYISMQCRQACLHGALHGACVFMSIQYKCHDDLDKRHPISLTSLIILKNNLHIEVVLLGLQAILS